jgi:hypothetical protein
MSTPEPEYVTHTFQLWEGQSVKEAWGHLKQAQARGSAAVPQFAAAEEAGKAHVWVNLRVGPKGKLLGIVDADGNSLGVGPDTPYDGSNVPGPNA